MRGQRVRTVGVGSAVLGVVLAAVLVAANPSASVAGPLDPAAEKRRPATQTTKAVPVRDIASLPAPSGKPRPVKAAGSASVTTGSASVTLGAGTAGLVAAGDLPVTVGPAQAAPKRLRPSKAAAAPGQVKVQVDNLKNVPGMVVTVTGAAKGQVALGVPLDTFGNRFGGAWTSRLRIWDVTACEAGVICADAVPLTTGVDAGTNTLTSVVQLPAAATSTPNTPAAEDGEGATPAPSPTPTVSPAEPEPSTTPQGSPTPYVQPSPATGTDDSLVVEGAAFRERTSAGAASTTTSSRTATTAAAVGSSTMMLAVAAGASGSGGDFTASDLSAAGSWSGGGQGGDMTWSYPMRVPPSAGGLDPELGLSYSSSSVDGRTTSTNNQPSWVGEGFDLSVGFIERRYSGCADDQGTGANNPTKSGDLCFKSDAAKTNNETWDNATVSFGPHSGELVRVGNTSVWRLRHDDGSRFEKLTGATNGDTGAAGDTGEHWRMTTTDGVQYYFGRGRASATGAAATNSTWTVPVFGNHTGEPGYTAGNFAASATVQAWRWNLDHVVTPDQDSMTYYYTPETNRYLKLSGQTGTASVDYVRGGSLARVDYGQRAGAESTAAGAQVSFGVAERCFTDASLADCQSATMTAANAYHWPDVPFDQICAATCTATQGSPTFFSRKRLSSLTTQVRNAAGTGYDAVDRWDLTAAFPDPGDGSTASLALDQVQQTGLGGGSAELPPVKFIGAPMPNRVDGIDDAGPLNKWRVYSILSGSGENLSWDYSATDCTPASLPTPQSNTRRCFPVYWTPPGQQAPALHWFHKYVVTQVRRQDLSGASTQQEITNYTYVDTPAWHYEDSVMTPAKYRTWSQWRGYSHVRTIEGAATETRSVTESRYFRGMDGDRATPTGGTKSVSVADSTGAPVVDHWRLHGQTREEVTFNGVGGAEVSGAISDPWLPTTTTASDGARTAMFAGVASTRTREAVTSGVRTTTT